MMNTLKQSSETDTHTGEKTPECGSDMQFIASMSHEIRTPLNAIVGFANLLTEDVDPAARERYSQIIRDNSDVLLQLINDILDLSKIEAGTLEYVRRPLDFDALLDKVCECHRHMVRGDVELILTTPATDTGDTKPHPLIVNEDANRLTQVLSNLLTNSIKHTSSGQICVGYHLRDDAIEVYVSDTGCGIPADKLEDIFGRFVKLNDSVHGTGLGLPICRMIIHTLGGRIWAESDLGKGATLKFTIPYRDCEERKPSEIPAKEEPRAVVPGHKDMRYILVAEDVESNYMLIEALLADKYMLKWVKNGEEAVREVERCLPDLILMDIKMPVMDGFEALRCIRGLSADVPVVALTAYAFEHEKQAALSEGFSDYLTKPVFRNDLLSSISKLL